MDGAAGLRAAPPSPAAGSPAGADPDDDLVARVAAGDATAWREIVARQTRPILGCAWHMLGDRTEAEDVVQETFVRLMAKAGAWRPGGPKLGTWMYRVAVNLCIDRRRARRTVPLDGIEAMADPAAEEPELTARLDHVHAVHAALAGLPERQRVAVTLVHFQGLSNIEAAEVLDVSVEAVESLLARGRRALRSALEPAREDLLGAKR